MMRPSACCTRSCGRAKRRVGDHDGPARRDRGRTGCRWRCTRTGRTGRFIRRRRKARSTRRSSRRWAGRWRGSGSSTSRPIRRKRAAAVSGSIARSRIGWSTSCASRRITTLAAANRVPARSLHPALQRHVQLRARRTRRAPLSPLGAIDLDADPLSPRGAGRRAAITR